MNAFDVTLPDVAVMWAVPTISELISPLLETVATRVLSDAQENVTPRRMLPAASLATACACIVDSRAIEDAGALTVMDATDGFTTVSTSALEVTEPDVAVMLTVPGPTPVTRPPADTVATDGSLDVHVKL